MIQQGDVLLFQTNDGGDISVVNGIVEMSGGLGTAAYLSQFGGNELDDGSSDNEFSWWGNVDETQLERQYRSETQFLLKSIPATSNNLKRIDQAGLRDLQWFIDIKAASSVEVDTSLIGLNRIEIIDTIEANGEESEFKFTDNWKATQ